MNAATPDRERIIALYSRSLAGEQLGPIEQNELLQAVGELKARGEWEQVVEEIGKRPVEGARAWDDAAIQALVARATAGDRSARAGRTTPARRRWWVLLPGAIAVAAAIALIPKLHQDQDVTTKGHSRGFSAVPYCQGRALLDDSPCARGSRLRVRVRQPVDPAPGSLSLLVCGGRPARCKLHSGGQASSSGEMTDIEESLDGPYGPTWLVVWVSDVPPTDADRLRAQANLDGPAVDGSVEVALAGIPHRWAKMDVIRVTEGPGVP